MKLSTLVATVLNGGGATVLFSDDFGRADGAIENDWVNVVGSMTVTSGEASVATLAVGRAITVRDVETPNITVRAKCKWTGGSTGVIARYLDINNFFMAQLAADKLSIYERINGVFVERASVAFTLESGTYYTVSLTASGKVFSATVDGGNNITYTAPLYYTATYVGMRGSLVTERFDDFTATTNHAPVYTPDYTPTNPTDQVGEDAIFEWFQKPAAVRFDGTYNRTYISWIDLIGHVKIRYYDHDTSAFSAVYTVDDLYLSYATPGVDDHNAPHMLILPTGKIQLYYFVHDVNNILLMKESTNAEDISAWGERVSLSDGAYQHSYPQVKLEADGTMTVFYRRGHFSSSDEYFKQSADSGATWGATTRVIEFGSNGVYVFAFIRNDIIHLAWNKSTADGRWNIYYAYSDDSGTTWMKRDGTEYTLPITELQADLVYDSSTDHCYCWDIRADDSNNPYIVFTTKLDPANEYRFAQWNGEAWVTAQVTTSATLYGGEDHFYSGGIVIDPNNMFRVALAKQQGDFLEIETWISADSGATWSQQTLITTGSAVDNFRVQWVENYDASLPLVWCAGTYTGIGATNEWDGYSGVDIHCEITKANIP